MDALTHHELIELLLVSDQHVVVVAGPEDGVLADDPLRPRQLLVDPRQLVDRRGDPEARHVCRQQLLVQRVGQDLRLVPRVLPRPLLHLLHACGAGPLLLLRCWRRGAPLVVVVVVVVGPGC